MTMIETIKAAAGDVRSKPLAPLIGAAAVVIWCCLFYYWLGLPLGSFLGVVVVVVSGMILTGLLGVMGQQSLTLYGAGPGKPARLLGSAVFWLCVVVFGLAGVWLPWLLIQWVPGASGMGLQAASAAVRFTVAVLLFVTAWLMLCAVIRRVMESGGEDEINPDRPLDLNR